MITSEAMTNRSQETSCMRVSGQGRGARILAGLPQRQFEHDLVVVQAPGVAEAEREVERFGAARAGQMGQLECREQALGAHVLDHALHRRTAHASGANSAWASDTALEATKPFRLSATESLTTAITVSALISRSVTSSGIRESPGFTSGCT